MSRLFAGTPWDRPPVCERCYRPESECACPPQAVEKPTVDPTTQTAWLRIEKRAKGKVVTVVSRLDPDRTHLDALSARLKGRCGAGGSVKDGQIELQGEHLDAVEAFLRAAGYKTRRF